MPRPAACVALVIETLDNFFCEILRHKQWGLLIERIEQVGAVRLRPAARLVDARYPLVISRPARTPLPSSSALVATVVPCTIIPMSGGFTSSSKSFSSASITASDGSPGTEGTFACFSAPFAWSKAIRSVNVPPVSTPISQFATLTVSQHTEC